MPLTNSRNAEPATRIGPLDGEASSSSKRRSLRVMIEVPVTVFGESSDHKIFEEKTNTVTVSAHGACVILKADIAPQKPILLLNAKTGTEVQCRVVHRKEIANGRYEVGLEFARPLPRFLGINFPPEDWNPADRKKYASSYNVSPLASIGIKK